MPDKAGWWPKLKCALLHWRGYWYPEYPNRAIDGHGDADRWSWRCDVKGCPRNPRTR